MAYDEAIPDRMVASARRGGQSGQTRGATGQGRPERARGQPEVTAARLEQLGGALRRLLAGQARPTAAAHVLQQPGAAAGGVVVTEVWLDGTGAGELAVRGRMAAGGRVVDLPAGVTVEPAAFGGGSDVVLRLRGGVPQGAVVVATEQGEVRVLVTARWVDAASASSGVPSPSVTPPQPAASPATLPPASPQPRHDRAGAEYLWVPAGPGLEGFWMMRTPVTNAMWRVAVRAGAVPAPSNARRYNDATKAQHPVVYVTRRHARAYAAWVGGRLPRDAEWTWAAQGDDERTYPWGNAPLDATRANCRPHGPGDTTPVGTYPAGASPYGLLDMAGNADEWVEVDGGGDRPYIVRGGTFFGNAVTVTCGARRENDNDYDYDGVGFRVVALGP